MSNLDNETLAFCAVAVLGVVLMLDIWRQALQWHDSEDE